MRTMVAHLCSHPIHMELQRKIVCKFSTCVTGYTGARRLDVENFNSVGMGTHGGPKPLMEWVGRAPLARAGRPRPAQHAVAIMFGISDADR